MTGEYRISASRQAVWEALNDPAVLKDCLQGCDRLERVSDTQFEATLTTKVGPVKMTFKGAVELSDIDAPNGYTISGEGKGGAAGYARGGARVRLVDDGGVTVLTYSVEAALGGKLAQMGSRIVDGVARRMADDFFARLTGIVGAPSAADEALPLEEKAAPGRPAWVAPAVGAGVILILGVLIYMVLF